MELSVENEKIGKKTVIVEDKEQCIMVGYVLEQGSAWVLVGVHDETEADKLISEFKDTGHMTLELIHVGKITEVVDPLAVAKFKSDSVYFRHTTFVKEGELNV